MEGEFKDRLRRAMEANGHTQEQAAEAMHVSQPAISDWLRGEKQPTGLYLEALERYIQETTRNRSGAHK